MIPAAAHPLALQGPDSPLGDLLGYVVLFVVVVWPIIRGVVEQAQGRRAEFERKQRGERAGAGSARRGPARARSLDELLRGDPYVEALEGFEVVEADEPPPLPGPAASPEAELDPPGRRELVGDPFDDSLMGRDLVDDEFLEDVPSEDELESLTYADRALGSGLGSLGAAREALGPRVRRADRRLGRLERRLTPWQRAFVLKEALGPPAALRPFDDRPF